MSLLSLRNVQKTFVGSHGETAGIHEINLDIEPGELVSLLGPSGCGKTTTLRCIAGLETPDRGEIVLDGQTLFSRTGAKATVDVPPERRGLAMVFQNYALWPHLNVFSNVAFGLRSGHRSKIEIAQQVEKSLRNVQLWDQRDRKISEISGGQQQRVAVARALAPDPKVILFDEPLSNMDAHLRERMRLEILELQDSMDLTSIWVTHDQEEALGMSSRIVLINGGSVEQIGTPREIWSNPASGFVAGFIGSSNRMTGKFTHDPKTGPTLELSTGERVRLSNDVKSVVGDPLSIYVRTSAVQLVEQKDSSEVNVWRVPVEVQSFHGDYTLVVVRFAGERVSLRTTTALPKGTRHVYLHISPDGIMAHAT